MQLVCVRRRANVTTRANHDLPYHNSVPAVIGLWENGDHLECRDVIGGGGGVHYYQRDFGSLAPNVKIPNVGSPGAGPFTLGAGVNDIHVYIDKEIPEDCADPDDAPGSFQKMVKTVSVPSNDITKGYYGYYYGYY